ncbi:MAG: LexA family transcriptional regulator [Rhodobacteraceae bacterium]|nr:LexA family transcriptional regulator [Paracoccaceae bacterium]
MQNNIKSLRKSAGLTQNEVADRLGIHLTNYNRLENGKSDITASRMFELATIFECDAEQILFETPSDVRFVPVRQAVQAGDWAEAPEWQPDDQFTVPIPDEPEFRKFRLHAAEARGPSMNLVYPERTIVIFTTLEDAQEDVEVDKRYVVERERADGFREATVKKLWRDDTGKFWLLPESDDPRYQEPIALNGEEGDTIRIVGRVVYSVRRE